VREAVRRGVRVLGVTDHDSTEGLADALDEAAKHPPLEIVPGLEINCDVEGGEVHVLGYHVDYAAPWFQEFLRSQREERRARVHRIVARLAELGMPIDAEEVFALVKEGSAGRPHVAQVMVEHGYVKSVREAFDRWLHATGPANVPRRRLTPAEARVCESLFRTGSVDAVAEDLNLTRNTVRSHLKSIYAKFGVVSQGQLMQRLANSLRLTEGIDRDKGSSSNPTA
jgi:DNA-binding CsgD family transcriptional regulator